MKEVRTRGGQIARIIDMNGPDPKWPIAAWVQDDGVWRPYSFTKHGIYGGTLLSRRDLILERKQYQNQYIDNKGGSWRNSLEEALAIGANVRIGIIERALDLEGKLLSVRLVDEKGEAVCLK